MFIFKVKNNELAYMYFESVCIKVIGNKYNIIILYLIIDNTFCRY